MQKMRSFIKKLFLVKKILVVEETDISICKEILVYLINVTEMTMVKVMKTISN